MSISRRDFLETIALSTAAAIVAPSLCLAEITKISQVSPVTKMIPSTGILLPVIGMGSWKTFNVGDDPKLRDARTEVLREFFNRGGGMIDSSPMYGSSEAVIGYGLAKLGHPKTLFSATKVWTPSVSEGLKQIQNSQRLWGIAKFDLMQIHNLVAWQDQIKTLFKMKERGELKHVGITTSHGRRHAEFEKIMRDQPIDFVQLTYNLADRAVEEKLLPLAQKKGIAVIANRPYDGGDLINQLKNKPLPPWAAEINCGDWPRFLLKWIVSHPAITCAIPATSKVAHMRENMAASTGRLPDAATRDRMARYIATL